MCKYEKLKTEYPEYVSLDQLRVICKIAKRTACYLVTNGIIPCIDTGKKTWRYKILIDDVISYLRRREQWGSQVPPGTVSSRKTKKRKSYSQIVEHGQESVVAKYFECVYTDYPDILTTTDMAEITGLHKKSFWRIFQAGHIKFLVCGRKYLIPKEYAWEFVKSRHFINIWSDSEAFIKVLEDFKAWMKNS